uniref:Aha1_N domain-containing protein n=1 Tax=Steinernema glaseri TaxID=37863 RepID=A0A1I7ZPZ9_9BILA
MSDFSTHENGLKFSREILCHQKEGVNEWTASLMLDATGLEKESVFCQVKSRLKPEEATRMLKGSARLTLMKGEKGELTFSIYDPKAFDTEFFMDIDKQRVPLPIRVVENDSYLEEMDSTQMSEALALLLEQESEALSGYLNLASDSESTVDELDDNVRMLIELAREEEEELPETGGGGAGPIVAGCLIASAVALGIHAFRPQAFADLKVRDSVMAMTCAITFFIILSHFLFLDKSVLDSKFWFLNGVNEFVNDLANLLVGALQAEPLELSGCSEFEV